MPRMWQEALKLEHLQYSARGWADAAVTVQCSLVVHEEVTFSTARSVACRQGVQVGQDESRHAVDAAGICRGSAGQSCWGRLFVPTINNFHSDISKQTVWQGVEVGIVLDNPAGWASHEQGLMCWTSYIHDTTLLWNTNWYHAWNPQNTETTHRVWTEVSPLRASLARVPVGFEDRSLWRSKVSVATSSNFVGAHQMEVILKLWISIQNKIA